MEYLHQGTRSRDKTSRKYKKDISIFFKDQIARIMTRFDDHFNIKAEQMFPLEDTTMVMELLFPRIEDDLIAEATKPLHTSGIQKAIIDTTAIATSEIIIDAGLTNINVVQRLNDMGKYISRVNDASKNMIRDVVLRGVRDGDNILTIRDNILNTGLNEYYENRALAIARTETRIAYDAGSKLALDKTNISKFDVIGCIGTLGVPNELGLVASYGDMKEIRGSCGVLKVDMLLWDQVSSIHHPQHNGLMVSSEKL